MKKFIFLVSSILANLVVAQQVLIEDFSAPSSYTIAGFEGLASASIVADPVSGGTRGNGFQLVNQSTGNPWQGGEVLFSTKKMKLTTDKTVKVDVYSTQAFTMLAKVENGAPASATSANYTTPGAWQTLTFSFTNGLDGTVPANGEYQKMVFFGNWKADNSGFNSPPGNFAYSVDNITSEQVVAAPDPVPATSAPNPTQAASDVVLSLFNDKPGYTPAYVQEGAFGSRTLVNLDAENDETMKFTFSAGGWGQYNNTTVNISAANYLHLSYYVPSATPAGANGHGFYIMINSGSGEKKFYVKPTGGDATMVFDSWQTVSIPMTFFTSQGFNPASFLVWKIDSDSDINTKLLYIDNIFFTKSVLGTSEKSFKNEVKLYPNPVSAGEMVTVDANVKSLEIYNSVGQRVKSADAAKVLTQGLEKGLYIIKTTNDKGEKQSSKLIVK